MLKSAKHEAWRKRLELFKTSLRYNTQVYFDNSSLHGVKYIREKDRNFCERFLWFSCTTIGGVACLLIIMSLWDKFQTSPTITGLDADTQTFIVNFPGVSLCPNSIVDKKAVEAYVNTKHMGDPFFKKFFMEVANMSYYNMKNFKAFNGTGHPLLPNDVSLADLQIKFARKCEDVLKQCTVIASDEPCCNFFKPQLTEIGYCLAYNTRHVYDPPKKFVVEQVKETDDNMGLTFEMQFAKENLSVEVPLVPIFLYDNDQMPTVDFPPQLVWTFRINSIYFQEKYTYSTPETRQLSIKQRRCIFADEIKLDTDIVYSHALCMIQCRMRLALTLCGCVPPFYPKISGYPHCKATQMACLANNTDILRRDNDCNCELGCMNTRYDVERLQDAVGGMSDVLELAFLSWPMYRYKREVLFGWVDLLVAFGGILGLFLGFSLLSCVEVIYYFTMRTWCMVYRNEEDLKKLKADFDREEKPRLDLSLTPYFMNKELDALQKGFVKVAPEKKSFMEHKIVDRPQAIARVPCTYTDFML